jgi:Zn-dependent oligopeptidase
MGAVKSSRHALDSKQVAAYFSLDNCLNGLALLCHRLFGITLQQVRMEGFGCC